MRGLHIHAFLSDLDELSGLDCCECHAAPTGKTPRGNSAQQR
jgi:hypothetical protein